MIDNSYKLKEHIQALYGLFEVPLLLVQVESEWWRMEKIRRFVTDQSEKEYFGVVLEFSSHENLLKRLYFLLVSQVIIYRIRRHLNRLRIEVDSSYGVYPSVSTPAVFFELGKQSERYINKFVMPPMSAGLSGHLRKLIQKFIKFHPSVAGVLILAKREL